MAHQNRSRRMVALLAIAAALALALAACQRPEVTPAATTIPEPTQTPVGTPATPGPGETATPAPMGTPGASALDIGSMGNNLEFDKKEMSAPAGATVTVTLHNNATSRALQHNWVLVKEGTVEEVAAAGLAAGAANDWVPKGNPNVIAFVALTNGGSTNSVTFKVPDAGEYDFACIFPGHSGTMYGEFTAT